MKQFVVIGLGRFGQNVAKTLYSLGNDVLAIDHDEEIIQSISDEVTHAVQVEVMDEASLKALGIRNFDVAVIAIGGDVQTSILVTLLCKELGVPYVVCKATSDLHARLLYKIGADKVILPERDMAVRVAHNLSSEHVLDFISISPDINVVEMEAPASWSDKKLRDLAVGTRLGVNIMAIKRGSEVIVAPDGNTVIHSGDVLVAIGETQSIKRMENIK